MSTAEELWNDPMFILKRKDEQYEYMMGVARCPVRSKEHKKKLLDSASAVTERFVKRFCELQNWDYKEHQRIAKLIREKMKQNGL